MLEDIFNVLFLIYLSLPLLFYKKYDLNLKKWYNKLFEKTIQNQQPNQPNQPKQQNQKP